jgi:hypothetical protein
MSRTALLLLMALACASSALAEEPSTQAAGLSLELILPDGPLELRAAHETPFTIRLINQTDQPQVVWPYVSLQVLDAAGETVRATTNFGRWGRTQEPCFLREVHFVTIAPGEAHEVTATVGSYMWDPGSIMGWELPGPGTYSLTVTHAYQRAPFTKRCQQPCGDHDQPETPWNQAVEARLTAQRQLVVVADVPPSAAETAVLTAVETYLATLVGQHPPETIDRLVDWEALHQAHGQADPRVAALDRDAYRAGFLEQLQQRPKMPAEAWETMREGILGRPTVSIDGDGATVTLPAGQQLHLAQREDGWRIVGKGQAKRPAPTPPSPPRSPGGR